MELINLFFILPLIGLNFPRLFALENATTESASVLSKDGKLDREGKLTTKMDGEVKLTGKMDGEELASAKESKSQTLSVTTSKPHSEVLTTSASSSTETGLFNTDLNTDAVFRGFYVVLTLGCIFLIYIGIKTLRLQRHRASNKYKVINTKGEDKESFYPLAAEDGEDEEIFNATTPYGYT